MTVNSELQITPEGLKEINNCSFSLKSTNTGDIKNRSKIEIVKTDTAVIIEAVISNFSKKGSFNKIEFEDENKNVLLVLNKAFNVDIESTLSLPSIKIQTATTTPNVTYNINNAFEINQKFDSMENNSKKIIEEVKKTITRLERLEERNKKVLISIAGNQDIGAIYRGYETISLGDYVVLQDLGARITAVFKTLKAAIEDRHHEIFSKPIYKVTNKEKIKYDLWRNNGEGEQGYFYTLRLANLHRNISYDYS